MEFWDFLGVVVEGSEISTYLYAEKNFLIESKKVDGAGEREEIMSLNV